MVGGQWSRTSMPPHTTLIRSPIQPFSPPYPIPPPLPTSPTWYVGGAGVLELPIRVDQSLPQHRMPAGGVRLYQGPQHDEDPHTQCKPRQLLRAQVRKSEEWCRWGARRVVGGTRVGRGARGPRSAGGRGVVVVVGRVRVVIAAVTTEPAANALKKKDSVWLRKQLKGTAWLSAISSQSGRDTRGERP